MIDDSSGEEHNGGPSPTEDAEPPSSTHSARTQRQIQDYDASVRELHLHELIALLCCFLFPSFGAYLLHSIRNSLSRPSEGLVSNYNLTIFLLAAELRPLSHLVKLIQARTLHLQRIVEANRPTSVDERQNLDISDLRQRLADLETRALRAAESMEQPEPAPSGRQTAVVMAEARRALQPELDALHRAVRRCEKRATLHAVRAESRLLDLETKLADAAGLAAAAAAARSAQGSRGFGALLAGWTAAGLALPFRAVGSLVQLPFAAVMAAWDVVRSFVSVRGEAEMKACAPRRKASRKGGVSRSGSERESLRKVAKM